MSYNVLGSILVEIQSTIETIQTIFLSFLIQTLVKNEKKRSVLNTKNL